MGLFNESVTIPLSCHAKAEKGLHSATKRINVYSGDFIIPLRACLPAGKGRSKDRELQAPPDNYVAFNNY